jgi:hypothetical protein
MIHKKRKSTHARIHQKCFAYFKSVAFFKNAVSLKIILKKSSGNDDDDVQKKEKKHFYGIFIPYLKLFMAQSFSGIEFSLFLNSNGKNYDALNFIIR